MKVIFSIFAVNYRTTFLYTLQSSDNLPEIGYIYEYLLRLYTFKNNQKRSQSIKEYLVTSTPSQ